MGTMDHLGFDDQKLLLEEMAAEIARIAADEPGVGVNDVLERAGDAFHLPASQMKYALSFADVNHLVKVDYSKYTVVPA